MACVKDRVAAWEQRLQEMKSGHPVSSVRSTASSTSSTCTSTSMTSSHASNRHNETTMIDNPTAAKNVEVKIFSHSHEEGVQEQLVGRHVAFAEGAECGASIISSSQNAGNSWMQDEDGAEVDGEKVVEESGVDMLMAAIAAATNKKSSKIPVRRADDESPAEEKKVESSGGGNRFFCFAPIRTPRSEDQDLRTSTDAKATEEADLFRRIDDQIDDGTSIMQSVGEAATVAASAAASVGHNPWSDLAGEGMKAVQDLERVIFFTDVIDRTSTQKHLSNQPCSPSSAVSADSFWSPFTQLCDPTESSLQKVCDKVYNSSMDAYKEVEKTCKEVERTLFFTDLPDSKDKGSAQKSSPAVPSPAAAATTDPVVETSSHTENSIVDGAISHEEWPEATSAKKRVEKEDVHIKTPEVTEATSVSVATHKVANKGPSMQASGNRPGTYHAAVESELNRVWKSLEKTLLFTDVKESAKVPKKESSNVQVTTGPINSDPTICHDWERTLFFTDLDGERINSDPTICHDFERTLFFTDLDGERKHKANSTLMNQVIAEEDKGSFAVALQKQLEARMEECRLPEPSLSSCSWGLYAQSAEEKGSFALALERQLEARTEECRLPEPSLSSCSWKLQLMSASSSNLERKSEQNSGRAWRRSDTVNVEPAQSSFKETKTKENSVTQGKEFTAKPAAAVEDMKTQDGIHCVSLEDILESADPSSASSVAAPETETLVEEEEASPEPGCEEEVALESMALPTNLASGPQEDTSTVKCEHEDDRTDTNPNIEESTCPHTSVAVCSSISYEAVNQYWSTAAEECIVGNDEGTEEEGITSSVLCGVGVSDEAVTQYWSAAAEECIVGNDEETEEEGSTSSGECGGGEAVSPSATTVETAGEIIATYEIVTDHAVAQTPLNAKESMVASKNEEAEDRMSLGKDPDQVATEESETEPEAGTTSGWTSQDQEVLDQLMDSESVVGPEDIAENQDAHETMETTHQEEVLVKNHVSTEASDPSALAANGPPPDVADDDKAEESPPASEESSPAPEVPLEPTENHDDENLEDINGDASFRTATSQVLEESGNALAEKILAEALKSETKSDELTPSPTQDRENTDSSPVANETQDSDQTGKIAQTTSTSDEQIQEAKTNDRPTASTGDEGNARFDALLEQMKQLENVISTDLERANSVLHKNCDTKGETQR
jgi:hypothetical protein